ncbi:LysM peptidoglycan-binding domain-containing protein [Actinokineospora spheciospongiae]|uniref:LysM peptidoglycan-binding domain-containing protein n=1 Tax=Actinokineospora spheciospongiae TaxID=909613 RepID=UPI000D70ED5B|nr:hypothetical protein [Actinokineospora spheciospongiae]PWW66545.1 hypothetical protein DFQ13_10161 [Actinokineospora spheciospongiae]
MFIPKVMPLSGGNKLSQALNLGLALTGNAKAMLVPAEGGMPLVFTLNPKSVSLEKTNKGESERGVITSSFKDAIKATGNIRLKLKEAHLTGALVTQAAIDMLTAWATPVPMTGADASLVNAAFDLARNTLTERMSLKPNSTTPGGDSSPLTKDPDPSSVAPSPPVYFRLPVLQFMWGVGGPAGGGMMVNLEKFEIEYQRFDGSGVPVWAKVGLTLVKFTEYLPGTNPTSGGLPGRTRHVVTQGEGVVQIATRAYGSPQAWRAVAEANDLDDPLRVRPGRALRLPAPGERS